MNMLVRIVTGRWVKGKKMNEPYLTIWRSLMVILAVIHYFFCVQLLGYLAEWVEYIVRG